jgi:hypothetical protein
MRVWTQARVLERCGGWRRCGRPSCRWARRCRRRLRPAPAPAAQHGHGLVVEDVAAVVEQAVLAVVVKGSSATSVSSPRPGKRFFSSRTARGTRPSGLSGLAAVGRLQRRVDDRKQCHHRHTQRHAVFGHREQAVKAAAAARRACWPRPARGRGRRAGTPAGSGLRRPAVLAHQGAREGIAAQAARTTGGDRGGSMHRQILQFRSFRGPDSTGSGAASPSCRARRTRQSAQGPERQRRGASGSCRARFSPVARALALC